MKSSAPPGPTFDIAIIGGGVNGCEIARDTAGRGWSVYLCEKDEPPDLRYFKQSQK